MNNGNAERCPSGLRCNLGKVVWGQLHQGFESPPLCLFFTFWLIKRDENPEQSVSFVGGSSGFCVGVESSVSERTRKVRGQFLRQCNEVKNLTEYSKIQDDEL